MKTLKNIALLIGLPLLFLTGCATKNPSYNPSTPISATNPEYVAPTNEIQSVFQKAAEINSAIPSPIQAPISGALPLLLMVTTAVAGLIAKQQNNSATAHANAAKVLANTVAAVGASSIALNNSPDPATAATVAAHLQAAPVPVQQAIPKPAAANS